VHLMNETEAETLCSIGRAIDLAMGRREGVAKCRKGSNKPMLEPISVA
jgi:hypothetical protein